MLIVNLVIFIFNDDNIVIKKGEKNINTSKVRKNYTPDG